MAQEKRQQQRGRGRGPNTGPIRKRNCYFCKEKIEEVDYKNYNQLRRYVSEKGKIRSRRITGACRRHQRQVGPTGTLFGSVTATDIADEVWAKKRVRVDRRKMELADSIKRIGRYEVPVELFTDVTATLRLAIVPEGGELPPEEELRAAEEAEA